MGIEKILAIFGGAQIAIIALVTYLGKLWLTRFEIELQQTLDKAMHVSQAQFDREFLFYQDLWKHVSAMRKAIRDTILPFESIIETDDKVDLGSVNLREKCEYLLLKIEQYWEFVESNKPFFPNEMIEYLDSYRNDSFAWGKELLNMDGLTKEWYISEGGSKLTKLNKIADDLEKVIRTRLQTLGGQA
jgi:hypothetical protein